MPKGVGKHKNHNKSKSLGILVRLRNHLFRAVHQWHEQIRSWFIPTFAPVSPERLNRRFNFLDASCLLRIKYHSPEHIFLVSRQAEKFLAHEFDLLGSGPTKVVYGATCSGLEGYVYSHLHKEGSSPFENWLIKRINPRNRRESQRIWSNVDSDYHPIDWQLDFKSGYRWREREWHHVIRFGNLPGVDVKVPWELARLQHLPVLSLAATYSKAQFPNFLPANTYFNEVRNQILDFIANNPPGYGVNWVCAMDVSIRTANLLVAWDILVGADLHFDDVTYLIFVASIRSHARHIVSNMEWSPIYRGNHYLSNIVGLLFAGIYLPRNAESDLWLHLAVTELFSEIKYQFHEDGSTFEASICYHRLSAEMVLWGLALLDNLSPEKSDVLCEPRTWPGGLLPRRHLSPVPFHKISGTDKSTPVPLWCRERIALMATFTRALTRPDGYVTQFGDNDSGRFITLAGVEHLRASGNPDHPAWSLDHSGFTSAADAFRGHRPKDIVAELIAGLAGWPTLEQSVLPSTSSVFVADETVWRELHALALNCAESSRYRSEFFAAPGILDKLRLHRFPGMGCYLIKSPRIYMAIRCGEIGLAGLGAHTHCDQLGIELMLDGRDLVRDPGTYIYTALPTRRNDYRSANAHHVPRSGEREPADLSLGAFDLRGSSEGECLYFGPRGFIGRHSGYGKWIYRSIALEDDRIVIVDFSPDGLPVTNPEPKTLAFSHAYGRLAPRT